LFEYIANFDSSRAPPVVVWRRRPRPAGLAACLNESAATGRVVVYWQQTMKTSRCAAAHWHGRARRHRLPSLGLKSVRGRAAGRSQSKRSRAPASLPPTAANRPQRRQMRSERALEGRALAQPRRRCPSQTWIAPDRTHAHSRSRRVPPVAARLCSPVTPIQFGRRHRKDAPV
jgi:hypothetical protein